MIEKSARGGLGIFDEKLSLLDPDLCMRTGDDFGFKGKFIGVEGVVGCETSSSSVGEAPDAKWGVVIFEIPSDGFEAECAPGVEVWDETDAVLLKDTARWTTVGPH